MIQIGESRISDIRIGDKKILEVRVGSDLVWSRRKFVAVGDGGRIVQSVDGVNWTTRTECEENLNGITFGNGRFVAVGDNGRVVQSVDGANWTALNNRLGKNNCTAYGNGKFVALGGGGYFAFSNDGVQWSDPTRGYSETCNDVAYGGGRFVAVCENGITMTSTDGMRWVAINGLTETFKKVTYGNGRFVAADSLFSHVAVSSDGINWKVSDVSRLLLVYGLGFGDGMFVAAGNGGSVLISEDGESWDKSYDKFGDVSPRCIAYGGGMLVAAGVDSHLSGGNNVVYSGDAGLTWLKSRACDEALNGIVYA